MSVITLPERACMADYQRYIHELEAMHGWLEVDLVHNGFLMTEEVGELFKAIRNYEKLFRECKGDDGQPAEQTPDEDTLREQARSEAADEIADVLNYLLAIANRLDIDVERAFRRKNSNNQRRRWA
ncbi:MAG TPA: hypothetical protein ENK23_06385 [Sorangium sp.]|nr:hypothetical protein [Sorangium sp.]